jgi:hypothetical protein
MTRLPRLTATEALQPNALERAGYLTGEQPGARRGQVFIMFAIFLTAMLGVLGLSIDVGYAVSQKRMMQNAADLAAIAGALSIANYHQDNQIAALTSVQQTIDGNQTHEGSPALEECLYTDDSMAELGACDGYVPAAATGVTILVRETHPTFFIRIVPGAPAEVSTRARATARVERLFRAGMDGPFIVCGYDTKRMDGSTVSVLLDDTHVNPSAVGETFRLTGQSYGANFYTTGDNSGATIADCGLHQAAKTYVDSVTSGVDCPDLGVQTATGGDHNDIDVDDDPYDGLDLDGCNVRMISGDDDNNGQVRAIDYHDDDEIRVSPPFPDGIDSGDEFLIEDAPVNYDNYGQVKNAKRWTGFAENQSSSPNNNGKELNQYWYGRPRNDSGRIKYNITGLEGCEQGDAAPYSCVLLLPVATNTTAPKPGATMLALPELWVVKVLAFQVSSCGTGCYQGTLLDDYPVFGGSVGGWCRDCGAVTVIKLKE